PNLTLSPDSFDTSMTSPRAIRSSSSAIRPSFRLWASFAECYSAFSERSPWARASEIASMIRGRSSRWRQRSSSLRASNPAAVMGTLFMFQHLFAGCPARDSRHAGQKEKRPAGSPRRTRSNSLDAEYSNSALHFTSNLWKNERTGMTHGSRMVSSARGSAELGDNADATLAEDRSRHRRRRWRLRRGHHHHRFLGNVRRRRNHRSPARGAEPG